MGYSFMAVLISHDAITQLFSSRDDAIYARMSDPSESYARFLMNLRDGTTSNELNAFEELLEGGSCREFSPHLYAYAIEAFCFEFGESLGSVDSRDHWRAIEFLSANKIYDELFFDSVDASWLLPIADTPDYPLVGWFSFEDCVARRDALRDHLSALPAASSDDQRLGLECLEFLERVFAEAVDKGIDLVVFHH